MQSLSRRIAGALVGVVAVAVTSLGAGAYAWTAHAARRMTDMRLIESACALETLPPAWTPALVGSTAAQDVQPAARRSDLALALRASSARIGFQLWDASNHLAATSPTFATLALDATPPGFADVTIGNARWRVYTVLDGGRRWIRTGERTDEAAAALRSASLCAAAVVLLALTVLFALARVLLRRALRPLDRLAAQIARRGPGTLDPVAPSGSPHELEPVIAALNGLLQRVRAVECAANAPTSG